MDLQHQSQFDLLEPICNIDWHSEFGNQCEEALTKVKQIEKSQSTTAHLESFDVEELKEKKIYLCGYVWSTVENLAKQIPKSDPSTDMQLSMRSSEQELIGLKNLTILEKSCKFALYTSVLPCLDAETSQIFQINIDTNGWNLFKKVSQIPEKNRHSYLEISMRSLLNILEHYPTRNLLWKSFGLECLGVILFLCFSPQKSMDSFFRESFQKLLQLVDRHLMIQTVFLLQGVARPLAPKSWLPNASKSLLVRRCLLQDGGVLAVIKVGLEMGEKTNWKRKEALASVVCVAKHPKVEELYANLGPQITQLIRETFKSIKENRDGQFKDIFHVLGLTVEQLVKDNLKVAQKFIMSPLFGGLYQTVVGFKMKDELVEIGEEIEILHKLCVETMSPACPLNALVEPFLGTLSCISSASTATYFKNLAHQIISRYLRQLDTEECVDQILIICGLRYGRDSAVKQGSFKFTPETVTFKIGESSSNLEDLDLLAQNVVSLLDKLNSGCISLRFYEKLSEQLSSDFNVHHDSQNEVLNTPMDEIENKLNDVKRITLIASLLNSLSENDKIVYSVFRDLDSAVPMLENFLRVGVQKTEDEDLKLIKESFCLNIVMLLRFYIENRQGTEPLIRNEWASMKQLLPLLIEISSCNAAVKTLVDELEILIRTHGATDDNPLPRKKKEQNSSYQQAIEELCSPEIPVRGHALIVLTRLLKEKDPVAMAKKDAMLILFKHHLKEEDTFIYLQCVEGLAVLCDQYHHELVPLLTKQLVDGKKRSPEHRIKLTEALTKATERLGDLLPLYKNEFINALLNGCRDSDELVRASSLSNLGEVCKNLRFSLGPIVHEVFEIIVNSVMIDESVIVRRASVMVVTLILRGLEKDMFKVLQNVLIKLYRFLKNLQYDPDEAIRIHSQLALEEIDIYVREFLTPKVSMKKKIYITEVPS